jgi:hypothetical protein
MNATVHSRAPAAPVTLVHVASDREPVATESPWHWLSASIANLEEVTYCSVGSTESDSGNNSNTDNSKFDDRVPQ